MKVIVETEVTVAPGNKLIIDGYPWIAISEEDAINIVVRNKDINVYIIDYNGIESLVTFDTLRSKLTWEGLFVIEEEQLDKYKEFLNSKVRKVKWDFHITDAETIIHVEQFYDYINIT